MNQIERMERRIKVREEKEAIKRKEDTQFRLICLLKMISRWKIIGKLWQKQAKELERELKG